MRRFRWPTAISLMALSILIPQTSQAQEAPDIANHPRVVEALNLLSVWMDAHRAYEEIPGISAAVVLGEDVLWSDGFGFADLATQRPATAQTAYSICSISKLFTSISAMRLREEGLFRLDDEVSSILPWFTLENQHPAGPPITVEGLLTHSAGIPRESAHPYWTPPFDFPSRDEVKAGVPGQQTLYPAWEYFQYSNLGLTLVGEIVAEVSGQDFTEYVREHILSPLGMTSTTPEIGEFQGSPVLATGYSALRRTGDRKVVEPFAGNGIAPAMAFASTVEDMAKFAAWQFRLLRTGEAEILPANTLREMHRVHYVDPSWNTTWGLGFSVSRRDDKTFVGHGGSCPGYRSSFELQVGDSLATVVMANAMVNTSLYNRRAYELLAPALKAAKGDEENKAESTPEELLRYVGVYDSYPWGGESQVIPWKGGLAVVSFPTEDPLGSLTRLKHIEGHTFRRMRKDETLAEERIFEVDANGDVVRMWSHGNSSPKIR